MKNGNNTKTKDQPNGETLLYNQVLCQLLKASNLSLQHYRSTGDLPFRRIRQNIDYLESDVHKFISRNMYIKRKIEACLSTMPMRQLTLKLCSTFRAITELYTIPVLSFIRITSFLKSKWIIKDRDINYLLTHNQIDILKELIRNNQSIIEESNNLVNMIKAI